MPKNYTPQEKYQIFTRIYEGRMAKKFSVLDGCKIEGISRATYFRWKKQYQLQNGTGLINRSRRPQNSPNQISKSIKNSICKLAKSGKYRFASNIKDKLNEQNIKISVNTVIKILRQEGCYNKMVIQKKNKKPYISRINCR